MLEPRPYQKEALEAVIEARGKGATRQLISLPTGCGKTVIFGMVAEILRCRTLILAHREELLTQARDKVRLIYPEANIGILKAEERGGLDAEICVASVQTAVRRIPALKERGFRLLICDEAHHAVSPSYLKIFDELGFMEDGTDKLLLGVTATAYRADNTALGAVFQKIVFERSILAMMKAGYLCDLRGLEVKTGADLSGVHTRSGDFAIEELAGVVDTPARNALIADTYLEHGQDRRGVAFCVNVEHAINLAEAFKERGIPCEAVYGDMPADARRDVLRRYEAKGLRILTNCAVLTEGWDCPDTDIVMMARPTRSRGLYAQCVGRGLRLAPGKADCLLVDFADTVQANKICGFGTLAGQDVTVRGNATSLLEAVEEAEREKAARQNTQGRLVSTVQEAPIFDRLKFNWVQIDAHYKLPLHGGGAIWVRAADGGYIPVVTEKSGELRWLANYPIPLGYALGTAEDEARKMAGSAMARKDAPWREKAPSAAQLDALRKMKLEVPDGMTRGQASDLMDAAYNAPATSKQVWLIKQNHLHKNPELLTKREASKIITAFKARKAA